MSTPRSRLIHTLTGAVLLGALSGSALADPAHKWRVEFGGRAASDGIVVLRLNPINGKSIDVETRIPARSSEENVARAVADSLRYSLGERYHIETDDGEDVIIRSAGDGPKFDLVLERSSVSGLEVDIDRE